MLELRKKISLGFGELLLTILVIGIQSIIHIKSIIHINWGHPSTLSFEKTTGASLHVNR